MPIPLLDTATYPYYIDSSKQDQLLSKSRDSLKFNTKCTGRVIYSIVAAYMHITYQIEVIELYF